MWTYALERRRAPLAPQLTFDLDTLNPGVDSKAIPTSVLPFVFHNPCTTPGIKCAEKNFRLQAFLGPSTPNRAISGIVGRLPVHSDKLVRYKT